MSRVPQLGSGGAETQVQVLLSPDPSRSSYVWTRAWVLQGLGVSRKCRTDVIRVQPLPFGFTSNKDDRRKTKAPDFPSLKTKARPRIVETGSI